MRRIAGIVAIAMALATDVHAEVKLAEWQVKALTAIKSEPKVKDAMWSQDISLWVGLDDDGTNRSGFGQYICIVLSQQGRPDGEFVAVRLLDHAAFMNGKHKELGKAICQ